MEPPSFRLPSPPFFFFPFSPLAVLSSLSSAPIAPSPPNPARPLPLIQLGGLRNVIYKLPAPSGRKRNCTIFKSRRRVRWQQYCFLCVYQSDPKEENVSI